MVVVVVVRIIIIIIISLRLFFVPSHFCSHVYVYIYLSVCVCLLCCSQRLLLAPSLKMRKARLHLFIHR